MTVWRHKRYWIAFIVLHIHCYEYRIYKIYLIQIATYVRVRFVSESHNIILLSSSESFRFLNGLKVPKLLSSNDADNNMELFWPGSNVTIICLYLSMPIIINRILNDNETDCTSVINVRLFCSCSQVDFDWCLLSPLFVYATVAAKPRPTYSY